MQQLNDLLPSDEQAKYFIRLCIECFRFFKLHAHIFLAVIWMHNIILAMGWIKDEFQTRQLNRHEIRGKKRSEYIWLPHWNGNKNKFDFFKFAWRWMKQTVLNSFVCVSNHWVMIKSFLAYGNIRLHKLLIFTFSFVYSFASLESENYKIYTFHSLRSC